MDIRAMATMEIKKGDHMFYFSMPVGAPYGQAYDAAFEALSKITEFAKEAAEKQNPNNQATPITPEVQG